MSGVEALMRRLEQAGDRAVADVRRDVGYDVDEGPRDAAAYVEALESKVRELACAVALAGAAMGKIM